MRNASLLVLLMFCASTAQANESWRQRWSSLWRTADQRGEQLLQQGDAAAAARTYADPRRRAYAELRAGNYPDAARDYAAFDDSDAHYNRGNALAHTGDLAAALKAYDTALARDATNRDARHNRERVAKALQQQSPPPKQASSQRQSGKQGEQQQHQQGKSGEQSANRAGGQSQDKSSPGPASETKNDKSGQPGRKAEQGQTDSRNTQTHRPGQQQGQPPANPQNAQTRPPGTDSAAQARRDAEASLGRAEAKNAAARKTPLGQGEAASLADRAGKPASPRSEHQLAQEQWLRQIPDDPGGLLRRKFMIEHLMRQQGNQP